MNELLFPIPQDVLTATIEAMRDLKGYYESDACSLAKMPSKEAQELAQERLESAGAASGLYAFYLGL